MVTLSVILGVKDMGITDIKRVLRLYFIQQLAKDELVRSGNMLNPDFDYIQNSEGIGLLDPLGIGRASVADSAWLGLSTEVYLFVAVFFFISCFGMARYSLYLENKLNTGHKR
jgi:hypothetical protein